MAWYGYTLGDTDRTATRFPFFTLDFGTSLWKVFKGFLEEISVGIQGKIREETVGGTPGRISESLFGKKYLKKI